MAFRLSIALHLIGIVLWLGGLILIPRMLKIFVGATAGSDLAAARMLVRRLWLGYVIPGMTLAVVTGVYQVLSFGVGTYMRQGWFHGKLTLVIVLFAVTGLVWREVARTAAGAMPRRATLGMAHGLAALALVLIVFLTVVGRYTVSG